MEITLSALITLGLAIIGAIWKIATLNGKVDVNCKKVVELNKRLENDEISFRRRCDEISDRLKMCEENVVEVLKGE